MAMSPNPKESSTPCFICGSIQHELLFTSKDYEIVGDIVRCRECGLASVSPMPSADEVATYDKGMYKRLANRFSEQQMERAKTSMSGYLAELHGLGLVQDELDMLDLGGGLGYYSRAAQEAGCKVTLVDLDPVSIDFACEYHRLSSVFLGDTAAFRASCGNRSFDVVLLRHVIEHLPNPVAVLKDAISLLRPHGVIILETDNNSGVEMLFKPGTCKWYLQLYRKNYLGVSFLALLAKRPFAVDPPRHLFAFSLSNLTTLLESVGAQSAKNVTYRLGHPVYWPNLPDSTLRSCSDALRKLQLRGFLNESLDFSLIPIRRLLSVLGMSAGICVYVRKKLFSG